MGLPVIDPLVFFPFLLPLFYSVWRLYGAGFRLTAQLAIDVLARSIAVATAISYSFVIISSNLPAEINLDVWLTPLPLTIVGSVLLVAYVCRDLKNTLDVHLKEPKEVKTQK
ncbi:MAG: hypothetical protein AB1295_01485 [Candidatus Micrarchaeota archaeon]